MRLAIFYGSTYGDTADAADRIAAALSRRLARDVPCFDIGWRDVRELEAYDVLLVGCSTWNTGELQAEWDAAYGALEGLDLRGKRVALFGTGDAVAYADTYLDALGVLAQRFEACGADLVGSWPASGYGHLASRAQRGDRFVGLALDYENQESLTDDRVEGWTERLLAELARTGAEETAACA